MKTEYGFIFLIALAHICVIGANMDKEALKARLNATITKMLSLF